MEYNTKILIADENPAERQILREALNRAGWRLIDEATNGEEALLKLTRTHYDAALIDMMLTRLDGIGVLRSYKTKSEGQKSPVFMVISPAAGQTMINEAVAAGADLCLMKPFDATSLCEHLRRLLEGRQVPGAAAHSSVPDIETQVTKIIHQIGVPAHI